jgi:hypothetical protein
VPVKVRIRGPSQSFFAVGLGFLIALPGGLSTMASAGHAGRVQVGSPSQAASTLPSPARVRPGAKLVAELQSALDVLAARTGDEIVVRITGNFKQGGRTVVHQGDRLVGRVTSVRPQSVGNGQQGSEIAIVFDRLTSGGNIYRLNAVLHSVIWTPGQRSGTATEPNLTQPTQQHTQGLHVSHAGMGGGPGGPVSHGGEGRAGEKAESSGDYPQGGKTPSDSIKARSRRAPDGGAGYVSVLTDRQGNFRLSAGTRLDFRTQSQ